MVITVDLEKAITTNLEYTIGVSGDSVFDVTTISFKKGVVPNDVLNMTEKVLLPA